MLKVGAEGARRVAESTRLFAWAESLGSVESLIEVPAVMTHASTANSPLAVDPGLVSLSAGIEHVDDLITDLEKALEIGPGLWEISQIAYDRNRIMALIAIGIVGYTSISYSLWRRDQDL